MDSHKNKDRNKSKNKNKIKKDKNKKWFKKWLLMPIVIFIALGFFLFNEKEKKDKDNDININLYKEVELLFEEKKPFVIILTDSNSQIARNEEKTIKEIYKEAHKELSVFTVDRAKNSKKKAEGDYFIDIYNVIGLPSIIICDAQGKSVGAFIAPFDVQKIIYIINELAKKNSEI